jgi:RHH-type proline utilization regulon transcriptional repressor/proline dehydrogenase/delta 1-pyrroline-5-carboxylate dehydrogenase
MRRQITAAYRRPETECIPALLEQASISAAGAARVAETARRLVNALRNKARTGGVEGLIHEFSLSSQEGVALMCLAEALLRVPDNATRDALIRDKIASGDWSSHIGQSPSLFVNAATWGLLVTGKLTAVNSETSLAASLTRLIGRGGEPLIRRGVDLAMRMMGEQFVSGQTIAEALSNSRNMEARGFRYSYDMLGEAATTAGDAARYLADYERAIHAIGKSSAGKGIYEGPGISVKLSALHPRYCRAKIERVMGELLPRLKRLALLARYYDVGLNVDAEEADRLEISLDVLEALATDHELAGWNGIGFVVQAYGKRCPFVVDWLVDLARRSKRRIMVRLVKGAYWDSEIKRAQVDGLEGFAVFTRKSYTDVSYLACARKLLAAPDAVFPQFATHNAQTLASIIEIAGPNFYRGQYEFQCLHGMGEPLYEEVIGPDKLNRPCRIYAPVGTHETLLAYLVRRLLENGANSSFVNRVADRRVPVEELTVDPVEIVRAMPVPGEPHERISLPRHLFGPERLNSIGMDLSNEDHLSELARALEEGLRIDWVAAPAMQQAVRCEHQAFLSVLNPADRRDLVGHVRYAGPGDIERALAAAAAAVSVWAATSAEARAGCLCRAADTLEARMPVLVGLIVREAGKSFANAIAEVREAVDFLRYYAAEALRTMRSGVHEPLGPVVCISPWNFPLAIFTGQVAAALAAGNCVLAKPAEQTPLIAAEAVRMLHAAGVPADVLQLVPGAGEVGAALVGDPRVQGVVFTGSTTVARLIQRQLASRLTAAGMPVPLIAETGGLNALVVDSSALAEQVVGDVIASAFDSAGQRCSALRILCLQEDIADRTLAMLQGALQELSIGNPARLSTDIGPVITREAKQEIERHVAMMQSRGHKVARVALTDEAQAGTFVAPTIVEIGRVADVEREVFGPVLHVLRYRREDLDGLIDQINASGYGLTFGLHSRIDETISRVVGRIEAGNLYINRNMIGAVVGVQPFGGNGLSGTGPKAGGPLYLGRLLATATPAAMAGCGGAVSSTAGIYVDWLKRSGRIAEAECCLDYLSRSALGASIELTGPVGERNVYALRPRGAVAAVGTTEAGLLDQIGAILATGNTAIVDSAHPAAAILDSLPGEIASQVRREPDWLRTRHLKAVLFEGDAEGLMALNAQVAALDGPIISVLAAKPGAGSTKRAYDVNRLLDECSISTNTAAAGGNASLMTIG